MLKVKLDFQLDVYQLLHKNCSNAGNQDPCGEKMGGPLDNLFATSSLLFMTQNWVLQVFSIASEDRDRTFASEISPTADTT